MDAGDAAEEGFSSLFFALFDAAAAVAVLVVLDFFLFLGAQTASISVVAFIFFLLAAGCSSARWRLLLRTGLTRASTSSSGISM